MRKLQVKSRVRIYQPDDLFPYGKWKGQKLSVVAREEPFWLERWQQHRQVKFSTGLQEAIRIAKFLNQ